MFNTDNGRCADVRDTLSQETTHQMILLFTRLRSTKHRCTVHVTMRTCLRVVTAVTTFQYLLRI